MDEALKEYAQGLARKKFGEVEKLPIWNNLGSVTGVSYAAAPHGAQTYSAGALVGR